MQIVPFIPHTPNPILITDIINYSDEVKSDYKLASKKFDLSKQEKTHLFIHKISSEWGTSISITAKTPIQSILSNKILKHENILEAKTIYQAEKLLTNKMMVKPILLVYEDVSEISKFLVNNSTCSPTFEFRDKSESHQLWTISDENIPIIQNLFNQNIHNCIIADGHHRISAIEKLIQEDELNPNGNFLAQFISNKQTNILPFHRFFNLPIHKNELFDELLDKLFTLSHQKEKFDIKIIKGDKRLHLNWKNKFKSNGNELDVDLLNELFFAKLNIKNKDIKYIHGNLTDQSIQKHIHKTDNAVGIILNPISYKNMSDRVHLGGVMPPKSTWFTPRVRNGIICSDL